MSRGSSDANVNSDSETNAGLGAQSSGAAEGPPAQPPGADASQEATPQNGQSTDVVDAPPAHHPGAEAPQEKTAPKTCWVNLAAVLGGVVLLGSLVFFIIELRALGPQGDELGSVIGMFGLLFTVGATLVLVALQHRATIIGEADLQNRLTDQNMTLERIENELKALSRSASQAATPEQLKALTETNGALLEAAVSIGAVGISGDTKQQSGIRGLFKKS